MAGAQHPPHKTLDTALLHGYETATDTEIGGVEIERHKHAVNKENEQRIVERGKRTAGGCNPIGGNAHSKQRNIAQQHLTTEIMGIEQRRVAPVDEDTRDMEIRHGKGRGQQGIGHAPLEMEMQQHANAEHSEKHSRKAQ